MRLSDRARSHNVVLGQITYLLCLILACDRESQLSGIAAIVSINLHCSLFFGLYGQTTLAQYRRTTMKIYTYGPLIVELNLCWSSVVSQRLENLGRGFAYNMVCGTVVPVRRKLQNPLVQDGSGAEGKGRSAQEPTSVARHGVQGEVLCTKAFQSYT